MKKIDTSVQFRPDVYNKAMKGAYEKAYGKVPQVKPKSVKLGTKLKTGIANSTPKTRKMTAAQVMKRKRTRLSNIADSLFFK